MLRFSDRSILDLSFLPRLSRHSASGALCRHHHSTTFLVLFLSSTKDAHQQAKKYRAAGGDNDTNLDITTPRLTEKTATELC